MGPQGWHPIKPRLSGRAFASHSWASPNCRDYFSVAFLSPDLSDDWWFTCCLIPGTKRFLNCRSCAVRAMITVAPHDLSRWCQTSGEVTHARNAYSAVSSLSPVTSQLALTGHQLLTQGMFYAGVRNSTRYSCTVHGTSAKEMNCIRGCTVTYLSTSSSFDSKDVSLLPITVTTQPDYP